MRRYTSFRRDIAHDFFDGNLHIFVGDQYLCGDRIDFEFFCRPTAPLVSSGAEIQRVIIVFREIGMHASVCLSVCLYACMHACIHVPPRGGGGGGEALFAIKCGLCRATDT